MVKINFIKEKLISLLLIAIIMVMPLFLKAEIFFVDQNHSLADDNNPGTESLPFKNVQQGINTAGYRDTVFIKNGSYNLSGFSKVIDEPLTILGENKNTTVLDNIGTLYIKGTSETDIFTLKNIKFTNYQGSIFDLTVRCGDKVDGVLISDCIFDKVELLKTRVFSARYGVCSNGIIKNINISNCDFLGLRAPGANYIYIIEGIISNINITNNNFYNLISTSDTDGATAIQVGTNSNRAVNKDILISGNFMDNIVGGTEGEIETHGILAYGENLQILNNTVKEMNPGVDHEAIYMKGTYSLIANNVMINCTSHQGAIAIKGTDKSFSDTIRGNRVQSTQSGRGIYTAGAEHITMEDNYVKCTFLQSANGLYIIAANGTACFLKNNYSQSARAAAVFHDVIGGEVTGNTLISYDEETLKLAGSSRDIFIDGNIQHSGWPENTPTAMATANIKEGEAPLNVNFSSTGSVDPNGEIVSYEWNFHDGTTSSDPNPSHTFTEFRTHTVTLIVTDADGFKDMAYVIIRPYDGGETVATGSIAYYREKFVLNIYPNPFSSLTNITFNLLTDSEVRIEVYNLSGKLVKHIFDGKLMSGEHKISWDGRSETGREMARGTYFIKCKTAEYEQTKRIIFH